MRIDSVHVERYGRVEALDTGEAPLPSIVVVLGPNESGKSTFFSFLTDLLYGFSPARSEKHPYAPWDGGSPEGKVRIRLADGGVVKVHRRLLASGGWGRMTAGGRTDELRNKPLPFVQHVSRNVFRQVYAISLPELAALKEESWERVQDRLTGAMGATDLRSARDVAAELASAANALWRPDRRGQPLVRVLSEELRELEERRREALASDREVRRLVEERAAEEARLAAVREEQRGEDERRRGMEHRLNRLRHVARTWAKIEDLRKRAGDEGALDGLPPDPVDSLAKLRGRRREADERVAESERKAVGARHRIRAYEEHHQRTAEAEGQVREAARRIAGLREMERKAAEAEREEGEAARRWEEHAQDLFSAPWREWDEATVGVLRAVGAAELGSRVEAYSNVVQKRQSEEQALEGKLAGLQDAERPGRRRLVAGLSTLATASLWLFSDAMSSWTAFLTTFERWVVVGISVLLVLAGIALVVIWFQDNQQARRRERDAVTAKRRGTSRIAGVKEEETAARRDVAELVEELPVVPELLTAPDSKLAVGVERAAEAAAARARWERVLKARRGGLEEERREIARIVEAAGLGPDAPTPQSDAEDLLRALDAALQAREDAEAAQRELERADEERSRATREGDEAGAGLQQLTSRLAPLGDGDPDRGAAAAAEMLDARRRADGIEAELREDYPELDELRAEIRQAEVEGERWDKLEEAIKASGRRLKELAEKVEELRAAVAGLDSDVRHMQEKETADRVASRIGEVEDRIRSAKRQRDRAFLLARLVEEADRRFREENQPELLRHASGHMRTVTGGRYDRIELDDRGDETFQLRGPVEPIPRAVEGSLSQGTREQVYLALRLAIVDRLDDGEETLPLFMDEVLVNWDAARRDRALDLLERVSKKRQVFFFTCHPAMAAELEDRGGTILPLGP